MSSRTRLQRLCGFWQNRYLGAMDWTRLPAPSLDEIEAIARAEFARLPAGFRIQCEGIVFSVAEFPDEDIIDDLELQSAFELLGLFEGATLAEREAGHGRPEPTMIFLYRRPILDYWAENSITLGAVVRHVLVHEIGHHFGLSDAEMEAIERE
jgi:predicted Zn-dependent protease with MMP-like domain